MKTARVLILTLAAVLSGAVSSSPAWAEAGRPAVQDPSPAEVAGVEDGALRRPASREGAVTAGTFPSPSQCRGKSNDPHKASSTDNAVKGFAETSCVANVPYIEVGASVWRKRWWGYEKVGTPGFNSETNWYYRGASGIYRPCEVNRWRTVGQHAVRDVDGEWYSLETIKYADVKC
jgi:hypothetical protein